MPVILQPEKIVTLADLLDLLGGVPLDQIRFHLASDLAVEERILFGFRVTVAEIFRRAGLD